MKVKCEYCGTIYDDYYGACPKCEEGRPTIKHEYNIPTTILELKQWYVNMNLPAENVTRFFIGKDYKGVEAFGIYKDEITENFIVYKNKSDGSRAIRYEGKDEKYAVKELYLKLKDEIENQESNNIKVEPKPIENAVNEEVIVDNSKKPNFFVMFGIALIIAIIMILFTIALEDNLERDNTNETYRNKYKNSSSSSGWIYNSYSDSDDYDSDWDSNDYWDSSYTDWDSDW